MPLLSLVTLSISICFFPAPRSSPGNAVGAVQAGLGSPVSVPSPLLKLGVPRLTTSQTEMEAAIDAVKKISIILQSVVLCRFHCRIFMNKRGVGFGVFFHETTVLGKKHLFRMAG